MSHQRGVVNRFWSSMDSDISEIDDAGTNNTGNVVFTTRQNVPQS
jgi:hypothetical protein